MKRETGEENNFLFTFHVSRFTSHTKCTKLYSHYTSSALVATCYSPGSQIILMG